MKMRFSTRFCRKCLAMSLSVDDMIRFAKMTYRDYDFYGKYSFSKGHPVGVHEAADRITTDFLENGNYVDFIETLIRINSMGYMGHKYAFRGLDDVFDDLIQCGYVFDNATGLFFEDQSQQVTRNWGRLMEGDEKQMAIVRLDIAGNSILVKNNSKQLIDKAYNDLRKIVTNAVVSRLGRLWIWEGDGALGVFMLGDYSRVAVLTAMDILDKMFLYNKAENPLKSDINLRIAVHSGDLVYSENDAKVSKADIVKTAIALESKAAVPNSLVISENLAMAQDQALLDVFSNVKIVSGTSYKFRTYNVSQAKN